MNQDIDDSRLACSVADMLHKETQRQNYQDVDALKDAVDHLNENGPERPCNVRICPSSETCLNVADLALRLHGVTHLSTEQTVTVVLRAQDSPDVL